MSGLGAFLSFILFVFTLLLIARIVFDYVRMFARDWVPSGIVLVLLEGIYWVTDPPVKALRRVIPPVRLGGVALDPGHFEAFGSFSITPSTWLLRKGCGLWLRLSTLTPISPSAQR